MTPDVLAKSNSEHAHQRALFAWANMAANYGFAAAWDDRSYTVQGHALAIRNAPVEALAHLYAIPNGGFRDKVTAGKLKAEGVKRGVPDIFLPALRGTWAGMYVELKRPQTLKAGVRKKAIVDQAAGQTSNEQDIWIAYLRRTGYAVAVAFEWREAAKQLHSYLEWGING